MLKTIDYTKLFADATVEVLATFLEEPAVAEAIREREEPAGLEDVVVLLGITGSQKGRLLLEFSRECALALCEAMNFGEPFAEFDSLAADTLCELANLAGGRAITLLNDSGSSFSIAPPTILIGSGLHVSGARSSKLVPVKTSVGMIGVNVSLETK